MILIILNIKDKIVEKRIDYIFNQIMLYLGLEYKIINKINKHLINKCRLVIYYGHEELDLKNKKNSIQIISNKQKINIKNLKNLYYFKNKSTIIFKYDIILQSFMALAREEEINTRNLDKHNRFIAKKSEIFDDLNNPVINKYAIILYKLIKDFHKKDSIPFIQKCHWPGNKKFAVCLTHDVDVANFVLSDFLSINKVTDFIKRENPYWQFNRIVSLEEKYKLKSTFFFCTEKKHNFDPNYSIKEKKIADVIKFLINNGNEIGLHASYLSYNNKRMMKTEQNELSAIAGDKLGVRTHFLRFNMPKTFILENELGFYYDSSLGYSDVTGYRNGFCWAYNPYISGVEKELKLFELPLSIMDSTLFEECKTVQSALNYLKKMLYRIEGYSGIIVLNWHQRVFNEKHFRNWSLVYEKCLDYFKKKDAFVGTAKDIIDWVVKRNLTTITSNINKNLLKLKLVSKANLEGFAIRILNVGNTKIRVYTQNYQIIKNKESCIILFKNIKKGKNITLETSK